MHIPIGLIKISSLTKLVSVLTEKLGQLSIERETETKQFEHVIVQKNQQIEIVSSTNEMKQQVRESTTDSDDVEYPLVGCSTCSVSGAVSQKTPGQPRPWALSPCLGKANMLQCPECHIALLLSNLEIQFITKHPCYINLTRLCQGIPGVISCNQRVFPNAAGKHLEGHIQRREYLTFMIEPPPHPPPPFLASSSAAREEHVTHESLFSASQKSISIHKGGHTWAFKCNKCGKGFSNIDNLQIHRARIHYLLK